MIPSHFLIVGGMRCGSTYLVKLLDQHSEVLMGKPFWLEPKFFLNEDSTAIGKSEYLKRYFPNYKKFKCLGEKSVNYFEMHEAGTRIKEVLPEAKIVIILRDPVNRVISHYWYTKNHGYENRTIAKVFERLKDKDPNQMVEGISMPPYLYLTRGLYHEHVEFYMQLFGHDNVFILILENLVADPIGELVHLWKFLAVSTDFSPNKIEQKDNESLKEDLHLPASLLDRLANYFYPSNERLRRSFGLKIQRWRKPKLLKTFSR